MNVVLLTYTQEPERIIATAAKVCYSPGTSLEAWDALSSKEEDVHKFVKKLRSMGHMSPFEHANFTFAIDGISRACSHQLVRHRLASYSQQSQRYVHYEDIDIWDDFVYPVDENTDGFEDAFDFAAKSYIALVKNLMAEGKKEKEAAELARYVLPNAMKTNLVMTMNARELMHFFSVRCCRRAQEEINSLSWEMHYLLMEVCPTIFEDSGPSCLTDRCKEGTMSCGNPYKKEDGCQYTLQRVYSVEK
jgi:thymidylate synthase (FAD)